MQTLIWKSWPQNPHKNWTRIQGLNSEQMEELLFQYTGIKHVHERLETLKYVPHSLALLPEF